MASKVQTHDYKIKVIDPGREWRIIKDDGTNYKVVARGANKLICSCPSFKYRGTCKHVEMLIEQQPDEQEKEETKEKKRLIRKEWTDED